jgi:histone-lysine N-methyltransferase SETMAR
VPQTVDPAIGTAKFMLRALWGVNSFCLLDSIPLQYRFNAQYFVGHAIVLLVQTVLAHGRTRYPPRRNVHLDNCRVHFSKAMGQFLIENQLLHVPHPSYSPNLAPSDFWLFEYIKTGLAGRSVVEPEELLELLEGVRAFLEGIPAGELTVVFEGGIDQVKWVVAHNGQDHCSEMICNLLGFRWFVPGSASKTY